MARDLTAKPLSEEELAALAAFDNPTQAIEENRVWAGQRDRRLRELLEAQEAEDATLRVG